MLHVSVLDDVLDDAPLELDELELPEHLHVATSVVPMYSKKGAARDASAVQRVNAQRPATERRAAPRPRRPVVTVGARS